MTTMLALGSAIFLWSAGPFGGVALARRSPGGAAPSCDAGTLCVGERQPYRSLTAALAAAAPGTTIEVIAGIYHESVAVRTAGVTIRGIAGRPQFDCRGLGLAADQGCIVLAADGVTLERLELLGASLPQSLGANGACIRSVGEFNFVLRHISCHGSQDGLLSNGGTALIEDSEFYDNGWTGLTHNVYLSGNCAAAVVRRSIFRDARVGHEFKSRCRRTEISDSLFRSTRGSRDLDIPDGGEATVSRSRLVKTAGSESAEIVGFAAESCAHPADMRLHEVTIENSRPDASIHNFDKCEGRAIVLDGVRTQGLPLRLLGRVVQK